MSHVQPTCPTDLKCTEWQVLEPLLPTSKGGRPRKWSLRQIVNAIFYITRSGCAWRMLPKDFPPWQTVYGYFRRWTVSGLREQINAALMKQVRVNAGRRPKPSAGVIDGQSVKTSERGEQRGIELGPQYATPHNNVADIFIGQGKFDEARRELNERIRLAPEKSAAGSPRRHRTDDARRHSDTIEETYTLLQTAPQLPEGIEETLEKLRAVTQGRNE